MRESEEPMGHHTIQVFIKQIFFSSKIRWLTLTCGFRFKITKMPRPKDLRFYRYQLYQVPFTQRGVSSRTFSLLNLSGRFILSYEETQTGNLNNPQTHTHSWETAWPRFPPAFWVARKLSGLAKLTQTWILKERKRQAQVLRGADCWGKKYNLNSHYSQLR